LHYWNSSLHTNRLITKNRLISTTQIKQALICSKLERKVVEELVYVNLSATDRLLRVIAGFTMIAVDYAANLNWDIFILVIGCWGVLTSAFGFCPFYKLIGRSTCPFD
ncbi:MAG: YgaP family membrane protein, partial [Candidatus Poseidoniales archaeon]